MAANGFNEHIDQIEARFEVSLTLKTDSLMVLSRLLSVMATLDDYAGAIQGNMAWSYKTTRHADQTFKQPEE